MTWSFVYLSQETAVDVMNDDGLPLIDFHTVILICSNAVIKRSSSTPSMLSGNVKKTCMCRPHLSMSTSEEEQTN